MAIRIASDVIVRTPEALPLYYGLSNDSVIFFPTSFALGTAYLTPARELRLAIPAWQQFAREKYSETSQPAKYTRAVNATTKGLETAIVKKIQQETGSTKLWDEDFSTVIKDGHLENRRLTAEVASRRPPGPNVLPYVGIVVDSPFSNERSAVDYNHVFCRDDEYFWGRVKVANIVCFHAGTALIQCYREFPGSQNGKIRFVTPKGDPFLPFEISLERAFDVLIRHYGLSQSYYGLDKMLLSDPEIFSPELRRILEISDVITSEVVPQKDNRKKRVKRGSEEEADLRAINGFHDALIQRAMKSGNQYTGIHVAEFKDTPNELLSLHFESGTGIALRLLYNEELGVPLLLGLEFDSEGEKQVFPKPHEGGLPLYERFQYVDDRTKRSAHATLMLPQMVVDPFNIGPFQIPYRLKRKYRALIDKLNPENKAKLLRDARLFV